MMIQKKDMYLPKEASGKQLTPDNKQRQQFFKRKELHISRIRFYFQFSVTKLNFVTDLRKIPLSVVHVLACKTGRVTTVRLWVQNILSLECLGFLVMPL